MKKVLHHSIRVARHPTTKQLTRFGCVGVTAATVNFLVVIALVETFRMQPLVANVLAFLVAFQVSFYGHRLWTFASNARYLSSLYKFLLVAGFSFLLNEGLYALFLHLFHLQYILALFLVLIIVPPITFVLSKFWAFAL